jgi:hypothetical protein
MAFRTVSINHRCKLSYSLNYMIVRKVDDEKRIFLDDIRLLIINSLEVTITTALISELSKRKIKLILCNEKCNPECEMVSYQNNYYSYRKIKEQIDFPLERQQNLWTLIVKSKINNQKRVLDEMNKSEASLILENYINELEFNDASNREGHAAKVYFNALFEIGFNRRDDNPKNKYLNYGYSILLSSINRAIKSYGYLTELGIHHIGESNPFNLACDFIEPLRPLVDILVADNRLTDSNFKEICIQLLSKHVIFNEKEYFLDNAIDLYVESLLSYLKTGNKSKIKFIEYEL